ncbi:hypothetical protein Glove_352g15 [Diversispora epigaea]|uniref:WLM domain-containing protein n=1 Tax=Diversispora epigaea TaxID=1348612 RepID=A0A397HG51_9GLOM|nr:hypothetical protein Glove_352g15 [Diversispora epigaea]
MSEDALNFHVIFGKTVIQVENWPIDSTIQKIKEYVEEKTRISVDSQTLIYNKEKLKNDTTLRYNNFKSGIKVMLIGSFQEAIQEVKEIDSRITHQPLESRTEYAINVRFCHIKPGTHHIKVIEHFPNPDKAREILMKLRDDRGIRGIMLKHQWSVEILQELSPFEHKILGFNINAGKLISLRLRTDDMEGFRIYSSIREILLHELAHNVWGKHDKNFHCLNRQLNKEYVSISKEEFFNPSEETEINYDQSCEASFTLTASSSKEEFSNPLEETEINDDQPCETSTLGGPTRKIRGGRNKISKEEFYNPSEETEINHNQSFEGGTLEIQHEKEINTINSSSKEEIELNEKCGTIEHNEPLE